MSDLKSLEVKLDALHSLIAERVLPDLAVIKHQQGETTKQVESNTKRIAAVETKVNTWIQRGVGVWFVVGVLWTAFTFLHGDKQALAEVIGGRVVATSPQFPVPTAGK